LRPDDVVLLPAFGVPVATMAMLREAGCIVVDTTCGSVLNVWKNVERYAKKGSRP
jgi:4-hydroxy-3-methylbut-2-enyl diphosphate reductase